GGSLSSTTGRSTSKAASVRARPSGLPSRSAPAETSPASRPGDWVGPPSRGGLSSSGRQGTREAGRAAPTAREVRMNPPARTGRLLVVDDEVELMRALSESLREAGFEVTGLSDPAAAPDALRQGEFDLLLTDLMMPGTDGIGLLRRGLEIDPNLVGIIM